MIKVQTSEYFSEPKTRINSEAHINNAIDMDKQYAGKHLILDLWGGDHLDDCAQLERVMRDAAEKAGATLLHIHLHRFTEGGGVTGVALLAESHISVHTWPEHQFAAFDIFMCGRADPKVAALVLEEGLKPTRTDMKLMKRGRIPSE